MSTNFDVRVLLAILIHAVSTNGIYHKHEWVEYRPKEGLCGYKDNCICDGKMRSTCDACEGIGLRERVCTTECGVNHYTQFGLCVTYCDVTYPLHGSTCVAECPHDTFLTVKAGRSFCEQCDAGCLGRMQQMSDSKPVAIEEVVLLITSIIFLILLIVLCYCTTQSRALSKLLCQKPGTYADLLSEIDRHRVREINDGDLTYQNNLETPSTSSVGATNVSGFLYDVFFSQSDEDEWVENALEVLESEPYNLRCCYSQRDFVPGKSILDNIEDCITNSKCTVLLFTPAFVESEWCKIEHTLATTHTIIKPGRVVVPVMLKPCELPMSISTINYIDATEGKVHQKIFTAVKRAGEKRTYTPFSQLQNAMTSVINESSVTAFIPLQDKETYQALCESNELKTITSRLEIPLEVLHSAIKLIASKPVLTKRGYRCCWLGSNLRCVIVYFICAAIGVLAYSINVFINGNDPYTAFVVFAIDQYAYILVITVVNLSIHFAGKNLEVVYSRMSINSPKRVTSEIVNWILSKEYPLLIMWDYINCGCVLITCDTNACRKYIEDKENLKRTLHFDQENVDRKETSLLKGWLYEYAVRLRRRAVRDTECKRHRNDKTMCFCQFAEHMCGDEHVQTSPPITRRNDCPRKAKHNGGYERLDNAEG